MQEAEIKFGDVNGLVKSLRCFLHHDEIVAALRHRQQRMARANQVESWSIAEESPLLSGFQLYDKITLGGTRTPSRWPEGIHELVCMARAVFLLAPNFSASLLAHHRNKLLSCDMQYYPVRHEWMTAQHFAELGFDIEWCDVSVASPEFWCSREQTRFGVECKRFGNGVTEKLGDSEAKSIAAQMISIADGMKLCGEIRIDVLVERLPEDISPWCILLSKSFGEKLSGCAEIGGELMVRWDLKPFSEHKVSYGELASVLQARADDERAFLSGRRRNLDVFDHLFLTIRGPRRTQHELRDYLLDKLSRAVSKKFKAGEAAVLVIEWSKFDEVRVFAESEGASQLIDQFLHQHRQIAAVVSVSRPIVKEFANGVHTESNALVTRSLVTDFPDVAECVRLSMP